MRSFSRTLWYVTSVANLVVASIITTACSTLPVGPAAEPQVIVIRNRSNADIETVTLRETSKSLDRALRFGSISPAPMGVSQTYIRPTNAPRFPKTVTIEWIDGQGRTLSRDISLKAALRSAAGAEGEALVFEIGPYEDVLVYVENAAQTRSGR